MNKPDEHVVFFSCRVQKVSPSLVLLVLLVLPASLVPLDMDDPDREGLPEPLDPQDLRLHMDQVSV